MMNEDDRDLISHPVQIRELFENGIERSKINNFLRSVLCKKCIQKNDMMVKEYSRIYSLEFRRRWQASNRTKNRFLVTNEAWLNKTIKFECAAIKTPGRSKSDFQNLSYSGKFKRTEQLRKTETNELVFATKLSLKADGKYGVAKLLPNNQNLENIDKNTLKNKPSPLSPDKALALFVDTKLTKRSYQYLRSNAKENHFDMYPSYNKVREAKQLCYPENISAQEHCVVVPLQYLANHTTIRLMSTLELEEQAFKNPTFHLLWKLGSDGSSGQNEYKQAFIDGNYSDSNLLLTCVVPLQLYAINSKNQKIIIWQNPRPSSTVYCRPLKMQFFKETIIISKKLKKDLDEEIDNLSPTIHKLKNNSVISVKHKFFWSMVDTKMINSITDTSSQKCYLCGASPIDMNDIDKVLKTAINTNYLSFGITSLHAWIRCLECMLKIGYRIKIEKWQARGEDKNVIHEEKSRIQADFRSRLGLLVDQTKQGAGNTTDGNTARTFFQNYKVSAEITKVDEKLIYRFYVILQVVASGFSTRVEEFQQYCIDTARLFVNLYPWYRMPASIHKLLIHSSEIVKAIPVPIGHLSEEAQEARNKEYRRARERNSRKYSRVMTNLDVFNYMLITSDPKITSLRMHCRPQKKMFSPEALNMFKCYETTVITSDEDSE